MPNYHIAMGQALVINDLNNNTIYTGPSLAAPGNALQSCSAVIMINTTTNVAGMYHHPAASHLKNEAKQIIDIMNLDISPDQIWLYYGNVKSINYSTDLVELSSYLKNFVVHLHMRPANSGAVSVSMNGGQPQINTGHMDIEGTNNLTDTIAGYLPGGVGKLIM
ncbi:hypothetical protein [uncultured Psychrosphaera sp.]|jgi:hypothetical protein|uniref:hypothetical protein n=1 Tax=uncultured Psychrosphaera sp. TaxID=1403522 RepID=UPI002602CE59|nr:hypothetical protein [uncultured Psychrosphaera sp.]